MPSGCWEWRGVITKNGYGQLKIKRIPHYTHRVSYELFFEKIPKNLQIDHLCRNRACCNPFHLEAVTNLENMRRAIPYNIKHECPRGHQYNEENTYTTPTGMRCCRICRRIRDKKYYYSDKQKLQMELPNIDN